MSDKHNEQKVAIVTGATSGIGHDLAKDLISQGYKVALVGRRASVGEKIAAEFGENARFFQADLNSYDEQARMFSAVWRTWGRLDALCANAGIVDKGSVYILDWRGRAADDMPPAPDLECTDANWKGVVYGTQLATHFMRLNKPAPGGKIIVTGSVGAFFPARCIPEYCGTKGAIVNFVRVVAPILKDKDNITINVVHPGLVRTPIIPAEMVNAFPPEWVTPVQTVLKGYKLFLEDDTGMTGKNLEAAGEKLSFYELPEPGNGQVSLGCVTVYDPLFEVMHHERSGLPDAIQ